MNKPDTLGLSESALELLGRLAMAPKGRLIPDSDCDAADFSQLENRSLAELGLGPCIHATDAGRSLYSEIYAYEQCQDARSR